MASIAYHRNKKTGAVYVYSVESYWDKEKKAPRNKQVCIGKLDQETGEVIPSKRRSKVAERAASAPGVTVTSRVAGPSILLDKLTQDCGLDKLLKKCFPNDFELVLSLVYFIVHKGSALSRAEPWSTSCLHPFGGAIASQRISELLQKLSEDSRQRFLSLWLGLILENDFLCYDITSVSSYARHNEYTHFGYNRDGESLEQINLGMLFGQKSRLPAYFRRLPGNISDVSTLKTTAKSLDFLGAGKLHFVLDRGFYSNANIDELFLHRHKFTAAIPTRRKWVEKILDKYCDEIASPTNYLPTGENEALFATTKFFKWGQKNHRSWLHIFYNADQAAGEFDRFTRDLIAYRNELLSGKPLEEHEEFYKRYLVVKETPKRGLRVGFNDAEIQKRRKKYSGFFCILSNKIKNAEEALSVYRNKDVVENCFDDLKNHLDMKRLRVHSAAAMDSRLFLQFLALIYISSIRTKIQEDKKLKHMTVRGVMEEMETLTKVKYSNRYGQVFTETTKVQRRIMEVFDIELPA
ncbi:MAG: transposase [Pseudomonadota bacterium]|nr:transposase [Pseudomonadota bacterium]